MSAMIVLLIKLKYALPDNWDGGIKSAVIAAHGMELRTAWESSTLASVCIDDSQSDTWPLNLLIFSSCDMSSRLAYGGEPPAARVEHESVL